LRGLDHSRIEALVEITHDRDMKRVARRPRYTPLRCLLSEELGLPPMRHWRDALASYVREGLE
jgi:dTDP-4-dehydrorhamnose reductase